MKRKFICVFTVLSVVMLLFGCRAYDDSNNTSELDGEIKAEHTGSAESTQIESESITEQKVPSETDIVVSNITYGSGVVDCPSSNELEPIIYIDPAVLLTRTVTILGKDYNLIYLKTVEHPNLDKIIHGYTVEGEEEFYSSISFDAETDKIVKYCLKYDVVPATEQECINLLMSIIGEDYNLSQYEYSFSTCYWIVEENYSERTSKDYFYNCSDNEEWVDYSISYTRDICDIATTEYIRAVFMDDSFVIEVYDLGYTSDMFEDSLKHIDKLEASIGESLNAHIKDGLMVNDFAIAEQTMFLRNGITNIVSDVIVTVTNTSNNETYDVVIQFVTKFIIK